jgi:hypothetical protein
MYKYFLRAKERLAYAVEKMSKLIKDADIVIESSNAGKSPAPGPNVVLLIDEISRIFHTPNPFYGSDPELGIKGLIFGEFLSSDFPAPNP